MNKYSNVIRFAMQMEKDGASFFREKADRFENPTTRSLFERLSKVEEGHYEFLKKELEKYETDCENYQIDKEFMKKEGTQSIFEERENASKLDTTLKESDVPDLTVLRMAYLIEKDFADFYEETAEEMDNPKLKELFLQLRDWELTHESIFKTEYKRLKKEYMNLPWG